MDVMSSEETNRYLQRNMILIESKRKKIENILKVYPKVIIADVTSKPKDSLVKLGLFYPHESIAFFRSQSVRIPAYDSYFIVTLTKF